MTKATLGLGGPMTGKQLYDLTMLLAEHRPAYLADEEFTGFADDVPEDANASWFADEINGLILEHEGTPLVTACDPEGDYILCELANGARKIGLAYRLYFPCRPMDVDGSVMTEGSVQVWRPGWEHQKNITVVGEDAHPTVTLLEGNRTGPALQAAADEAWALRHEPLPRLSLVTTTED